MMTHSKNGGDHPNRDCIVPLRLRCPENPLVKQRLTVYKRA